MKKILLTFLLIGLFLGGCHENALTADEENAYEASDFSVSYISFSLMAPNNSGMRGETSSPSFQDGTTAENNVNAVRFYFFNEDGKGVAVREDENIKGKTYCYFDWSPFDDVVSGDEAGSEESLLSVTLELDVKGGGYPAKVVAIVNPNLAVRTLENPTLEELNDLSSDFQTELTESNFVMSNTAYMIPEEKEEDVEGNLETEGEQHEDQKKSFGRIICPVELNRNNFESSAEDAKKNPVRISVERVVARIDLKFGTPSENLKPVEIIKDGEKLQNVFDTGETFRPFDNSGIEKRVYVQFLGWAVTSSPTKSRLIKKIDDWDSTSLFSSSESWTMPEKERSFWAINPQIGQNDYFWPCYSDIANMNNLEKRVSGTYSMNQTTVYCQENANPAGEGKVEPANPVYPTKMICACRLIDETGTPISIAEYESKKYTPEGLMHVAANSLDMYWKSIEEGKTVYKKIQSADLTVETASKHNPEETGPDGEGSYYVYFKLSKSGSQKEWYYKPTGNSMDDPVKIEAPDAYIDKSTFPAKIWNSGYTYYFAPILHAGKIPDKAGYYGVVRNHLYDITIIKVSKLGTPVYAPDEVIYPEEPQSDGNMIVVEIKPIEWRIVKHNFQVSW